MTLLLPMSLNCIFHDVLLCLLCVPKREKITTMADDQVNLELCLFSMDLVRSLNIKGMYESKFYDAVLLHDFQSWAGIWICTLGTISLCCLSFTAPLPFQIL